MLLEGTSRLHAKVHLVGPKVHLDASQKHFVSHFWVKQACYPDGAHLNAQQKHFTHLGEGQQSRSLGEVASVQLPGVASRSV